MKEKKQNEELQSRREFFKKAAIAVLPIVGGIVLASCNGGGSTIKDALGKSATSLSGMDEESEANEPMNCNHLCANYCTVTCKDTCQDTCSGGCWRSCTSSNR